MIDHCSFIKKEERVLESPNTIYEELIKRKQDFIFLRHSLKGDHDSILKTFEASKLSEETISLGQAMPPMRYFKEYFLNVRLLAKKIGKNQDVTFVGFDPLNALVGINLKRKGLVKKSIYFTADYSIKRFDNKVLNWIYHLIDRFCVRKSDEVWNVSSRICDVRRKMGLPENKNIFLPNLPSDDSKRFFDNKRDKNVLITLGLIDKQLDFINLFDAINLLERENMSIKLLIAGAGPKEEEIRRYVKENGLDKDVIFLGYIDHDRALEHISNSGIGMALYNGEWGFNYFGDSMKCREFFSFGLPVITTDTHSTVDDIKKFKAGIVTEMSAQSYKKAIKEIIDNYETYSENSLRLGQEYKNNFKDRIDSLCK